MTEPTGICFLSYKRERSVEARLLLEALQDRGIIVWQDINDLPHSTTELAIEEVLSDMETACAVILVTPEVENSHVIRDLEAPLIFQRVRERDGFFTVPLAAGGLEYDDLSRVLGPRIGTTDISGFNVLKATSDPLDEVFAVSVAKAVLFHRLKAIAKSFQADAPVSIQVSTRAVLPKQSGMALRIDLRHRFDGRLVRSGAWEKNIIPAFSDIVEALQANLPGRNVILSGFPSLPAAVAFGAAFLSLSAVNVSWLQEQRTFGKSAELWGLNIPREMSGFVSRIEPQSASADDIALLVSATTDVVDDFRRSTPGLRLRAIVDISPASKLTERIELNAGQARDLACIAIDALRVAWIKYGRRGVVHLFIAAPAGVAFMIGQQLNTFGVVQTYEHVPGNDVPYIPAVQLRPSD